MKQQTTGDDEELLENRQIMAVYIDELSNVEPIKDVEFPSKTTTTTRETKKDDQSSSPWWPFSIGFLVI
jgi:hypothetical protein